MLNTRGLDAAKDYFAHTNTDWALSPVKSALRSNIQTILEKMKPWMVSFLKSDPADYIPNVKIPVLFLYGTRDSQVRQEINLPVAQRLLPDANFKIYMELNHLMQYSVTGYINEYAQIEETFSLDALADIVNFIRLAR